MGRPVRGPPHDPLPNGPLSVPSVLGVVNKAAAAAATAKGGCPREAAHHLERSGSADAPAEMSAQLSLGPFSVVSIVPPLFCPAWSMAEVPDATAGLVPELLDGLSAWEAWRANFRFFPAFRFPMTTS